MDIRIVKFRTTRNENRQCVVCGIRFEQNGHIVLFFMEGELHGELCLPCAQHAMEGGSEQLAYQAAAAEVRAEKLVRQYRKLNKAISKCGAIEVEDWTLDALVDQLFHGDDGDDGDD